MSAAAVLIPIFAQIGAPILKGIIEKHVGGKAGDLAGTVIDAVAGKIGVEAKPGAIEQAYENAPESVGKAIREVEQQNSAEWLNLHSKALEYQFGLLQAETKAGGLKDGWRWGWMYFLGILWAWQVIGTALDLKVISISVLMQLTGWFIALYMGGHTLKELGKNAVEAVTLGKGRDA